ncbi:hypothetical protein CVT25_004554 [Psilocybe cyanescens]|uniref:Uncharacterized protein n=1 Tax=Psilocybe cyanescens TaxID=93625 RepID=A0A409XMG1_PSICY|nr:hypothetical protein CVT25_004554 [Psilocybe cyanescens]
MIFGGDLGLGVPPAPALPVRLGVVGGESDESGGGQEEEQEDGMSAGGGDGGVESSSFGFDGFADSGSQLVDGQFPSLNTNTNTNTKSFIDEVYPQDINKSQFDMFSTSISASRIVDIKPPPSLLKAADITSSSDSSSRVVGKRKLASSTPSRTSDTSEGELNTSFMSWIARRIIPFPCVGAQGCCYACETANVVGHHPTACACALALGDRYRR